MAKIVSVEARTVHIPLRQATAFARRQVTAWSWQVELLTRGAPGRFRPFFTFEAVPATPKTK